MAKQDPTGLTDLELLPASLPSPSPSRSGLVALLLMMLVTSALGIFVAVEYGWLGFVVMLGLVFGGGWILSTAWAWWRGPEPCFHEFLRRHHGVAGEHVLRVSIYALPQGGQRTAWVVLRAGDPPSGWIGHVAQTMPGEAGESTEATLTLEDATQLIETLEHVRGKGDSNQRFEVIDGVPFDLEIHRRGEAKPLVLEGNLAAPGCESHSGCRLVLAILAAADAMGREPMLYGACDAAGNVTIGEL
jgi:hypothetical protein